MKTLTDILLEETKEYKIYFDNYLKYLKIIKKENVGKEKVFDIAVDKVHNFVANGCIVHNCHNFIPAEGKTAASDALLRLVKEGRQPGISCLFITQRPNKLHETVIAQSDLVISHRLTAKADLDALSAITQVYMLEDIRTAIRNLPRRPGAALLLDDNSERLFNIQVRPRQSWHAGGTPTVLRR